VYQFSSANATLDGGTDDSLDSCGSVMSDECKNLLRDSFLDEPTLNGCPQYQKNGTNGADAFKKGVSEFE
jgi:hypothetical protein